MACQTSISIVQWGLGALGPDGTPVMGGIAIVGSAVVAYLVAHIRTEQIRFARAGVTLMALIVGMAIVGFIDDYLGVRKARNMGLRSPLSPGEIQEIALDGVAKFPSGTALSNAGHQELVGLVGLSRPLQASRHRGPLLANRTPILAPPPVTTARTT